MPRREDMWQRLGDPLDLLVIGGGITGAGIARDAARRGLRVGLVEMNDLAFGTSSRSSKLIHGGLRYLEHYELGLVFEAVSERRVLLDIAPHLVHPLGFLFPIYEESRVKLWMLNAGMWLYDGLSLFRSPKMHRTLSKKQVAEEEPSVRLEGLKGAPLYYDCSTDDARLTLETALDAAEAGAIVATWTKATAFVVQDGGRVQGAIVEDVLGGGRKEVRANAIVNATGPWTDRTLSMTRGQTGQVLRPTKGVHLVVPAEKLPIKNAVVCLHPDDQRVLFAIPWGERTYVGTTDTDFEGDPADVAATADDIAYLIEASNAHFPRHPIAPDDVISTWAGIRPLIQPGGGVAEAAASAVSREHQILIGQDGLITIAGGKLTTYRRMAAEVVDTAVRLIQLSERLSHEPSDAHTERAPLPGGVGWPDDDDENAVVDRIVAAAEGRIDRPVARSLMRHYGMRGIAVAQRCATSAELAERLDPERPEIVAQIDWSVEEELAATICDVLVRRTQIFYRAKDQGLGMLPRVAARMAHLLGWDDARREVEVARYRHEVARSRAWRSEPS